MQKIFTDPRIPGKTIVYDENILWGTIKITVNGIPCKKQSKDIYVYEENGQMRSIVLSGNPMSGRTLSSDGIIFTVYSKAKWYEYVIALIPFVLVLVWGNSAALCSIVPVVGGAIGGAIGGFMTALNYFMIIKTKKIGLKVLIGVGFAVATFLICWLIAVAILSAFSVA